jgi:hypothetical protein
MLRFPKNGFFASSVEHVSYQTSNYAFCAQWSKGHVNSLNLYHLNDNPIGLASHSFAFFHLPTSIAAYT